MKKETYNLLLRFIAGLAASLILVGGTALAGEKLREGRTGVLYEASGIPVHKVALTVNGVDITAEEYLYYVYYGCANLMQVGLSDWDGAMPAELLDYLGAADAPEGMTVGAFVEKQARDSAVSRAVVETWAKELDITVTDQEQAAMDTQLAASDPAATGLSRAFLETQMRYELLMSHIVKEYTTQDGRYYPTQEQIQAGMAAGEDHGHEHDEATVAMELCSEEYTRRCDEAQVTAREAVLSRVDVGAFFDRMMEILYGA